MPRSFLVKQPKVHDIYHQYQQHWDDPRSVTHAIAESATNLAVRLSENGESMSFSNFTCTCACVLAISAPPSIIRSVGRSVCRSVCWQPSQSQKPFAVVSLNLNRSRMMTPLKTLLTPRLPLRTHTHAHHAIPPGLLFVQLAGC